MGAMADILIDEQHDGIREPWSSLRLNKMKAPDMTTPTDRLRLYELPGAIALIEARIIDSGGEIDAEIEAQLDGLEMALEERAEAVAFVAAQAEAEAAFFKAEEDRLRGRRMAAEKRAASAKSYLHRSMLAVGRAEIKGRRFRLLIAKSPVSIRWTKTLDELPAEFARIEVCPDLAKAREAFKAGAGLPGGFEVQSGSHLRIS